MRKSLKHNDQSELKSLKSMKTYEEEEMDIPRWRLINGATATIGAHALHTGETGAYTATTNHTIDSYPSTEFFH